MTTKLPNMPKPRPESLLQFGSKNPFAATAEDCQLNLDPFIENGPKIVLKLLKFLVFLSLLAVASFAGWAVLMTRHRFGVLVAPALTVLSVPMFLVVAPLATSVTSAWIYIAWWASIVGFGLYHSVFAVYRLYWPAPLTQHVHRRSMGELVPPIRWLSLRMEGLSWVRTKEPSRFTEPACMILGSVTIFILDAVLAVRHGGHPSALCVVPLLSVAAWFAIGTLHETLKAWQRQVRADSLLEGEVESEAVSELSSQAAERPVEAVASLPS